MSKAAQKCNNHTPTCINRTPLATRRAIAYFHSGRFSAVLDAKIKDLPEADAAKRAMHERALVSGLRDVIVEKGCVVVCGTCSWSRCVVVCGMCRGHEYRGFRDVQWRRGVCGFRDV